MSQADGEKNCFNCKWYPDNGITKGFDEVCHKCSNSDKWEGLIKRAPWEDIAPPPKIPEAQADGEYISKTELLKAIDTWDRFGVDNLPVMYFPQVNGITPTVVAQADGEYIPKQAVLENIDQWYEDKADIEDLIVKITYMPSVAIPPDHDGCKDCKYETYPEYYYPCCECKQNYMDEWQKKPHWIHRNDDYTDWLECPSCGYGSEGEVKYGEGTPFCPHCGERLEEE